MFRIALAAVIVAYDLVMLVLIAQALNVWTALGALLMALGLTVLWKRLR